MKQSVGQRSHYSTSVAIYLGFEGFCMGTSPKPAGTGSGGIGGLEISSYYCRKEAIRKSNGRGRYHKAPALTTKLHF